MERGVTEDEYHSWQFLDRAIELASTINDSIRIGRAKSALFAFRRKMENVGGKFMWWRFDDLTWEYAKALDLTTEDKMEAIDSAERALARHSDISNKEAFDPHWAMSAAERLLRRRGQTGELAEGRRALKTAGTAFEQAAKEADALLANAWLEDLIPRYRGAGMADDAARVEQLVRSRADQAKAEMKQISVPIEIPREELDNFSEKITGDDFEGAIRRFAAAFLVREDSTRNSAQDMVKNAPLSALMTSTIMGDDGFTEATVGSINDDLDGRAIAHAANIFNWQAPFVHMVLERIKQKHGITADKLLPYFSDSPLFVPTREPLLKEGLLAWLLGDDVKAIHVLVPQLEAALRELLANLGAPTRVHVPRTGGFEVIGMGAVLNHNVFITRVPKDYRFHFRALYCDPRGINLRNRVAHGLARHEQFHGGLSNWVVHSLILVGTLRFRQRAADDPDSAPAP